MLRLKSQIAEHCSLKPKSLNILFLKLKYVTEDCDLEPKSLNVAFKCEIVLNYDVVPLGHIFIQMFLKKLAQFLTRKVASEKERDGLKLKFLTIEVKEIGAISD